MTLVLIPLFLSAALALQFTGDVEKDFGEGADVLVLTFPDGEFMGMGFADVGVPPGWPYPGNGAARSGWDMKDVRLAYDFKTDQLHIGINCWDICGDADGNGDAGDSSIELIARGGNDLPNFDNSESFALGIDIGTIGGANPGALDGVMDLGIGYPADSAERLPCGEGMGTECFGIYGYDNAPGAQVPGQRFKLAGQMVAGHPAQDHNPKPTAARPDLEWTINSFNELRRKVGVPDVDRAGAEPWSLNFVAFAGSFQDDGVGEDSFPNDADFQLAEFPCLAFDACGVCGGDGSTCSDCAGVPNGSAEYDLCDVCDGDSAVDCEGTPCGTKEFDTCGVCGGDNSSCEVARPVCSEEFGNVCKLHPGDVWVGAYRDTNVDVALSEEQVTFTFAPNNYVMETNRLGTNWNRFIINDVRELVVQEFAAFPDRVDRDCAPEDVAKYKLKFSMDCKTAEIEAIIEPCRRREALYNNMQFTLQPPVRPDTNACEAWDGSGIWQAKYRTRRNNWTGKRQVGTFTFAPENHAVVESGDDAVYFYNWHPTEKNVFEVRDIGSQDFEQRCMQMEEKTETKPNPLPITAEYTVGFSNECTRATIDMKASDGCEERARRLSGLQLFRVPLPSPNDPVPEEKSPCQAACSARLSAAEQLAACIARCEQIESGVLEHQKP